MVIVIMMMTMIHNDDCIPADYKSTGGVHRPHNFAARSIRGRSFGFNFVFVSGKQDTHRTPPEVKVVATEECSFDEVKVDISVSA